MKRIITALNKGITNGHAWYMVVFGATLENNVLQKESSVFVPESIYTQLSVGQELTVKG
jgi:hypothetical protein